MVRTVIDTDAMVLEVTHMSHGAVTTPQGRTPIDLRIIDTHYPGGRKDCMVCVPRLEAKAVSHKGDQRET